MHLPTPAGLPGAAPRAGLLSRRLPLWPWLLFALCGLAAGCRPQDGNGVKIKGSDTVLPLAQKFAESFGALRPDVEISVTGGGSGVGIAALMEKTTDIAMSSRELKLSEKIKLQDAGLPVEQSVVAFDALALVVHPRNPVARLTREQLESLYTGQVTNWKDVGGPDMPVVLYSRESSSGTHEFFKEAVLDGREFSPRALMMPATGAIIQSVSQTEGAIGYVGLAYLEPRVKTLAVSYDKGKNYVEPTIANALNKTYPVVRPLYFLYNEQNSPRLKPFIEYVFSAEGQQAVQVLGFIPVAAESSLDPPGRQNNVQVP